MEPTPNEALQIAIIRSKRKQRAIAKDVRIHEARFSGIVRGRIVPNRGEQKRIARTLGVSVHEVFPPSPGERGFSEDDTQQPLLPMSPSFEAVK